MREQFAVKSSLGTLNQDVSRVLVLDVYLLGQSAEELEEESSGLLEDFYYKLGIDSLLDELLGGLEQLSGEDGHRGSAVSDLIVLGLRDLNEYSGRGMLYVQQV